MIVIASKEYFNPGKCLHGILSFLAFFFYTSSFILISPVILVYLFLNFFLSFYRAHIFIHLCLGHQTRHEHLLWYCRNFSKPSCCFRPASPSHRERFIQSDWNRVYRTSLALSTSILTIPPLRTKHWRLAMCTASVQFPGLRITSLDHSINN